MTAIEKRRYRKADDLRALLKNLMGKKFQLDCGHHVTFGYFLGNDIIIENGKTLRIVCLECGR